MMLKAIAAPRRDWTISGWALAGLVLIAVHAVLMMISPQFAYGELPVRDRPLVLMVALLMLAGAVYLLAVWHFSRRVPSGGGWWLWIILVGLSIRALMFTSTPMLETDYYRYLWDGAVTAQGHNPYAHAPQQVIAGQAPEEIVRIAEDDADAMLVLSRVNHPWLTTIYPPTAQVFFAFAHAIVPWRIEGLRIIWFMLDVATLLLLIALLRRLALPSALPGVIYWWNPLLVKEVYNSAHMEMTVLPFIVAALLLAVPAARPGATGRVLRLAAAIGTLAVATGAKFWPVILLPALLRQRGLAWRRLVIVAGVFAILASLVVSPMLLTVDQTTDEAGLSAYATTWQMNDTLYRGFHLLGTWIAPDDAHRAARLMVAAALLGWIAWLCRRPALNGLDVCDRALWIAAGLFLLSPTQYPWYWLWLLPMLAVRPSPGLLVLTATLPLYYLRFPMREMGMSDLFNNLIVWVQFGPCFILLIWEARQRIRRSRAGFILPSVTNHAPLHTASVDGVSASRQTRQSEPCPTRSTSERDQNP